MKSASIGLFPSDYKDASSWYRCVGPFGNLRRQYPRELFLSLLQEVSWATCGMLDVAVMQRPHLERHLRMAEVFVENGIPLWVDWDDQIHDVPKDNPNHRHYTNPITIKVTSETLAMADVVTVSTPALAQAFSKLNDNIIVIPNALDTRLLGPAVVPDERDRRELVFWRGSKTHREDLNVAAKAIYHLSEEFPEITWAFQGSDPWFTNIMNSDRALLIDALDTVEFHRFMYKIRPSIAIFPLVDNPFNHCKSNCGWLEASWAGAATLGPNWQEWQQPGISNYRSPDDFERVLRDMIMTRRTKGIDCARASWEHISRHLTINSVNLQRMEVLEGLLDGSIVNTSRSLTRRQLSRNDAAKLF